MARADLTAEWHRLCGEEQRLRLIYTTTMQTADDAGTADAQGALGAWRSHQARMREYLRAHASGIEWRAA